MDTEEKLKMFDGMINALIINLYTISKTDDVIRLRNFNWKDEKHKVLLNVAIFMCQAMNKKIELQISFWQYLVIWWKWRKYPIKRMQDLDGYDSSDLLEHIEFANRYPDAFKEIYHQYYDRKKV